MEAHTKTNQTKYSSSNIIFFQFKHHCIMKVITYAQFKNNT